MCIFNQLENLFNVYEFEIFSNQINSYMEYESCVNNVLSKHIELSFDSETAIFLTFSLGDFCGRGLEGMISMRFKENAIMDSLIDKIYLKKHIKLVYRIVDILEQIVERMNNKLKLLDKTLRINLHELKKKLSKIEQISNADYNELFTKYKVLF